MAPKTLSDVVDEGAKMFERAGLHFGHGTDNALDEAAYLAAYALNMPPDFDDAEFERQLTEKESQTIQYWLDRRINERKPAAYLTKEAWFSGLKFYVDERVLVPRSPIAELIQAGFAPWKDPDSIHNILDIGTGSGCIAIACAKFLPHAKIIATDISDDALKVAKHNVQEHQVADQIALLKSNLYDALSAQQQFDVIVSNPPYVDQETIDDLPDEHNAEPAIGFAGGDDGLSIVVPLLRRAREHLQRDGVLIVEVGDRQAALVERFPDLPFTWLEFEHGGHGVFLLEASQLVF